MLQLSSSACILISEHQVAFDRFLNRIHQRDNVALTYGVDQEVWDSVSRFAGAEVARHHSFLMFGGTD